MAGDRRVWPLHLGLNFGEVRKMLRPLVALIAKENNNVARLISRVVCRIRSLLI
jgi:hypothetical protein